MEAPPFHTWTIADGTLWTEFYRSEGAYLLRFPGLADFQVTATGDDITCFPTPDSTRATVEHLYLNQVLPLALSRQGKLVFHASAVELDGGAVAFIAESGRGKSTLAASLATDGCALLTDDGLVVEGCAKGFDVLPSHPSIRLWEDSRTALMAPAARSSPALQYTTKARILAGDAISFCAQPRPLRRAYFLGTGSASDVTFERLSASEAMIEWVKHSFLLDVEERSRLASHFGDVARLARQPIHYRLDYPRRYEQLPAVRQSIVEHAREPYGPA